MIDLHLRSTITVLLISATAEDDVNRQLDTYARELNVPACACGANPGTAAWSPS